MTTQNFLFWKVNIQVIVFLYLQVLYKMDPNGTGKLIKKNDINKCLKIREYTFEKFRHMCILSGCDYAHSIKGVGLQRGKKVVEMAGDRGIEWAVQNIREILKKPSLIVPDGYFEKFSLANNTFQHQSVFNPLSRKVVPLSGDVSNEYVLSRCQYPFKPRKKSVHKCTQVSIVCGYGVKSC